MTTQHNQDQPEGSTDRRRLLGAAVWVAPIIAASVAAPAHAASGEVTPT